MDMEFIDKWFLDADYSDEFEELVNAKTDNFDNLIENNLDKVFYDEEKAVWSNRILTASYLELSQNRLQEAELLFDLYFDKQFLREFFKNILRKSIYEYFVSLKFNTELNNGKYTLKELDEIIEQIEGLWVCTK